MIVVRVVIGLAALSGSAFGTTWFVDGSALAGGDGQSWSAAFRSPHAALSAAQTGDEIRVAQGVYKPAGPGGDRGATFVLKTGVVVRGGYAGLASGTPDARDPAAFATVWSGDLNGDDAPGFAHRGDNSWHIATLDLGSQVTLTFLGEVELDGLTFRGGEADTGSGLFDRGSAFWALAPKGAGLEAAARVTVRGCRFEDSRAQRGGAAHTTNIVPLFEDCVFEGNRAITGGGVEHMFLAFFPETPSARFVRCDFVGNEAESAGGAISHVSLSLTMDSCRFLGNAAAFGAGLFMPTAEDVLLVNCLFAGNTGIAGTVAFDDGSRTLTFVNCTMSGNVATAPASFLTGTLIESRASTLLALRNTVAWGNSGAQPRVQSFLLEVMHSTVEGGASGVGNVATDPGFVNAGGGITACDRTRGARTRGTRARCRAG